MSQAGVSRSHWNFSGRFWAGWSATWATLIAVVVSVPATNDKKPAAGTIAHASMSFASPSAAMPAPVAVTTRGFDLAAIPASAFGDAESASGGRHAAR